MGTGYRKVRWYVGGAFLISWTLAAAAYLAGVKLASPVGMAVGVLYMFGPLLSAAVVQRLHGEAVWRPLGVSVRPNGWWAVAWLLPVVLTFAALGVSLLLPGVRYSPGMEGMLERMAAAMPPEQVEAARAQMARLPVFWLTLGQALLAGPTINAVAAFGEEVGWRGLMTRELAPLGFWRASAVIGLVWGLWHAPLILQGHNYPQHPVAGVLLMVVFTVLLSPLIGWVRLRARSVVAAAVMHGTLNAAGGLALMVVAGGTDLTVGVTGAAGLVALAALCGLVALFERTAAREPLDEVLREEATPASVASHP